MDIQTWLKQAQIRLADAGVETARLDTLVLLEDALHTNRAQLLAHPEQLLDDRLQAQLDAFIVRRMGHEPLAYIRGKVEFYGREFVVSPAVLVPRPESETMIDLLKQFVIATDSDGSSVAQNNITQGPRTGLLQDEAIMQHDELPRSPANEPKPLETTKKYLTSKPGDILKIADIGTGSGNLGITAALEIPNTAVSLLEIDESAIEIAQQNIKALGVDLPIIRTDLLDSSAQDYDILLCNLPYVPINHPINLAARKEPKLAIFSGDDGLDAFRQLFLQIKNLPYKPRLILTESLPAQHSDLLSIAATENYKQVAQQDLIQAFLLHDPSMLSE